MVAGKKLNFQLIVAAKPISLYHGRMRILTTLSLITLFVFFACNRRPDKPKLTLSQYSRQAVITKGVIEKLLAESDYKKMHEIAIAIESSRAVNCTTVYDECNLFGQILNKIVSSTQTRLPNAEENQFIYGKLGEMDQAYVSGYQVLADEWKIYINAGHENEKDPSPK